MANVLVTGAGGQLGSELKKLAPKEGFFFTDRTDLDISDKEVLEKFITENKIDTIINCAAYTAVDKAEEDQENADLINHQAVRVMAELAKAKDLKLVHISTDYVFDGKWYKPYKEDDPTNPNSVYGATKRRGEEAILEIAPKNSVIIRTSWIYSSFGANFVKTMLRLGKEKKELGVIYDQIGTPTYAKDLASAILEILPQIALQKPEIYHYSNEGAISWYDFAKEIMKMAKLSCQINPIETWQYPTPAARPHYSLLNKSKIKKDFGLKIPYWKDSLNECLHKLGERK
jgi:dTDP-4-dehydrorhamnose reductase